MLEADMAQGVSDQLSHPFLALGDRRGNGGAERLWVRAFALFEKVRTARSRTDPDDCACDDGATRQNAPEIQRR